MGCECLDACFHGNTAHNATLAFESLTLPPSRLSRNAGTVSMVRVPALGTAANFCLPALKATTDTCSEGDTPNAAARRELSPVSDDGSQKKRRVRSFLYFCAIFATAADTEALGAEPFTKKMIAKPLFSAWKEAHTKHKGAR